MRSDVSQYLLPPWAGIRIDSCGEWWKKMIGSYSAHDLDCPEVQTHAIMELGARVVDCLGDRDNSAAVDGGK